MTPVDVVQRQLEAYNARDLEGFLATYGEDIVIYRLPVGEPSMRGKAQLADFYGKQRFKLPGLRAEIVNRIVMGNKVIDHERVFGVREQPFEAVAAYEVAGGLIRNVWFFNPE